MRRGKERDWKILLFLGVAAAAAVLLILLQRATTYTSDDYYYAMFWRDGLWGFIRKNGGQFLQRNGRVLVHMLASTFLAMDLTVYALFCTAMLGAVFLLLFRYQHGDGPVSRRCWAAGLAVFFLCLLAVDYRVMKSWFLCVADAFNYIYPLLMIAVFLVCLDRAPEGRFGTAALLLSAFLAGATTEQGGVMAVGLVLLTLLEQWFTEKRADRRRLWVLCAAVLGLLSIFASPGTRSRAAAEFSFSVLRHSYVQYANSLAAPGLSLRTMVFLSCAMGLLPLTKRAPKVLYAGLPLGALLAAGFFRPLSVDWNTGVCTAFFCYLLVSAAALIFFSPCRRSGFLLLAGMASAALVMLSRSCSVRVTTPLVLLMVVCGAFFLAQLYACLGGALQAAAAPVLAAVFALTVFLQVPAFRGVRSNYEILKENAAAAEEARITGVLEYRDYDPSYCLQDLFTNWLISSFFLSYYQLPPETQVVPTYQEAPSLNLDGWEAPMVLHDGRYFLPMEELVYHNGGSSEGISDAFLRMKADGHTILYHAPMVYRDGTALDASREVFMYQDYYYISVDLARTLELME